MYTRICLGASDFGLRCRRSFGREGCVRRRRVLVLHDGESCHRCKRLRAVVHGTYATAPTSKVEYVLSENIRAYSHTPHRCCADRCSSQMIERRSLDFAFLVDWRAIRNNDQNFAPRADRLLDSIARYNRLPMNANAYVSRVDDSVPCTVCTRAYDECVCYCRRVILPHRACDGEASAAATTTAAAAHHPRVRGFLAGNVMARMYTFWDDTGAYYEPRFMLHLARLGFVLTGLNCVRCTECLFLVSFWDMFCLFHYTGVARVGDNTEWHERLMRHLYEKRDLADIVRRCSQKSQKRDELLDGLRALNVWHAQLHPACSNIAQTERYARLMFETECSNIARPGRRVPAIPRFLAARQLGYHRR